MKKTTIVLLCLLSFTAGAQKKIMAAKVPASVKASFAKAFPDVKTTKWEAEKDGGYEVAFMQDGTEMTATFDASGVLEERETKMPVSKLPAMATTYIREHYKGAKIKEAAMLKMADGSTNYEAEVNGMDLIFDEKGNYLKSVKMD